MVNALCMVEIRWLKCNKYRWRKATHFILISQSISGFLWQHSWISLIFKAQWFFSHPGTALVTRQIGLGSIFWKASLSPLPRNILVCSTSDVMENSGPIGSNLNVTELPKIVENQFLRQLGSVLQKYPRSTNYCLCQFKTLLRLSLSQKYFW